MSETRHCLEILTPDEVRDIHAGAVQVLEETGLWLPHEEILAVFHEAGAQVDFEGQTVRIPGHLVEASIDRIPAGFTVPARNPAHSLEMDGSRTYFGAPDSAINIIELDGTHRPGTAADGEDICRLCDALPTLSVSGTGVHPPDLPAAELETWCTMTMFTHSSQAVFGVAHSQACAQNVLRMAEVVADVCDLPPGQVPLMAVINTVSPLYNTPDQLAGGLEYIKRGVPLLISPEVQAGSTGPVTLAGALMQATAEFLGHATLTQLVTPGMPVLYGCVSSITDMRTAVLAYGAPEADLLCLGTAQMARHYGIPSRGTGGSSDANALGMQAGVESLMSTLSCILAGVSYVAHGAGELENTLAVSFEKTVIDAEVIGMAQRLARGIEVNEETLARDLIQEVGPRGQYLTSRHTARHFRSEHFLPDLLVRDKYATWEAAGGQRLEERARDRAREILSTHEPEPLPEPATAELRAICEAARGAH